MFYPEQGGWTEMDYLNLEGGPLVEFDNGFVEVLDFPTREHQRIVQFLFVVSSIPPLAGREWRGTRDDRQ